MISKKQKMYLRSLANRLSATVQVGKDGISDNVVSSLDERLTAVELVKAGLLKNCELTSQQAAIELAAATHSEIIQIIGRRIVFYRVNPEKRIIKWPQ